MKQSDRIHAMEFAAMARSVAFEARSRGLRAPAFRTPPRVLGSSRSVQRLPDGGAVVSVTVRDRERVDVLSDLVEGVLVANSLRGATAKAMHRTLLRSVLASAPQAA
jgi:hypothetical protein